MATRGATLPAPPPVERRVLPVAGVLAVLVAVVFGGYVTAGALSAPPGSPVDVGGIVRVVPLEGWEVAERSPQDPTARLTRGSGTLDVFAGPFAGSPQELLREYVAEGLEPQAEQLSVSGAEPVTLASGDRGARVSYVGSFAGVQTPIEGVVTAIATGSGSGVIFDGWAPFGLLQHVLGDVESMIRNAEVA
jgi:hypothetical protein